MIEIAINIRDYSESLIRLAATAVLVIALLLLIRKRKIGMEREISVSALRGFIQLMVMASILLLVFEIDNFILTIFSLFVMISVASYVSSKRSEKMPDNFLISLVSIFLGSVIIIISMALTGALPIDAPYLIPLGGMVIGNCMNVTSLALDRLKSEIENNRLKIESYLALGSTSEFSVRKCVHESIRASLIPKIDGINTLGIIWIPGLMAGMLIAGVDPYVAAVFQINISIMILGGSLISSVISTFLMSRNLFTPALQLRTWVSGETDY